MSNSQEAKPLSRANIRRMAKEFRKFLGLEKNQYIDVIHVLDVDMPSKFRNFDYEIVEEDEMRFHGLTYPDKNKILIREDVYIGALNGNGRDRFTIVHEIFHYLFHTRQNIKQTENSFARESKSVPRYKDPEWQADAFAGEVLMDSDIISNMNVYEVMKNCGVSFSAAKVQKSIKEIK